MFDKIILRDLELQCIIGCNPEERFAPRPLVANITLYVDTRSAAASDQLQDTVNYSALVRTLREYTVNTNFALLEALAEQLAQLCLQIPKVKKVTVLLDKPGCILQAKGAAVEITRP